MRASLDMPLQGVDTQQYTRISDLFWAVSALNPLHKTKLDPFSE